MRLLTLFFVSAGTVCCTGGTSTTTPLADGGATAAHAPDAMDAALSDCDRQAASVANRECGTSAKALWVCPSDHAKPDGCSRSALPDTFCCPLPVPASCSESCTANAACNANRVGCEASCAILLDFVGDLDMACYRPELEYLTCVGTSASECRGSFAYASACEAVGERLMACQTKSAFVRSKADDAKCTAKGLPPRGYIANHYGYSPSCHSYVKSDTFIDGMLMCCS